MLREEKTYISISYTQQITADTKYGKMQKEFEALTPQRLNVYVAEYIEQYKNTLDMQNIIFHKVFCKTITTEYKEYKEA